MQVNINNMQNIQIGTPKQAESKNKIIIWVKNEEKCKAVSVPIPETHRVTDLEAVVAAKEFQQPHLF